MVLMYRLELGSRGRVSTRTVQMLSAGNCGQPAIVGPVPDGEVGVGVTAVVAVAPGVAVGVRVVVGVGVRVRVGVGVRRGLPGSPTRGSSACELS